MTYAILELSGTFRETQPLVKSLLPRGIDRDFRFDLFLVRVETILAKRKVATVLVDCKQDFRPNFFSGVESVRAQLLRLRGAGREVLFYAREYGPRELYLASGCTRAFIHPLGRLRFLGLSRDFLFFKKLLDKRNIKTRVVRRGRYKSAMDSLRLDRIDPAQQEQYEALLDTFMAEMMEKIRERTGKQDAEIRELLSGRILTAAEAAEGGWVEAVKTRDGLLAEWKQARGRDATPRKLANAYGRGGRIVVLVFEGAIVDGRSRRDPLLGQAMGAESYVPIVDRLTRDRSVKGVIFRINSGGGSAIASEEVLGALARLREKKPLLVSMSEVAASGGYWIATQAERVFAERTTVTGSIGVVAVYVQARRFLENLGITHATVKRGEHADLGSALREMSRREEEIVEALVEEIYQAFLDRVAAARNMSREKVHQLAQGRIWSGGEARAAGIVDELGGISEAVELMKERLGRRRVKVEFRPAVRYSLLERIIYRRRALQAALPIETAEVAEALALPLAARALARLAGGPLALMVEQLWMRSAPW